MYKIVFRDADHRTVNGLQKRRKKKELFNFDCYVDCMIT